MTRYQYPLDMRFKLLALAPRIIVTDANGQEVLYVHQKTFAFKEDIRIYSNQSKLEEVYNIRAEKVIDFNARYNFYDSVNERHIGSTKARSWRSLWRATYILDDINGQQTHFLQEVNPWVNVTDNLVGEIPIVGMLTAYLFHPSYTVYQGADTNDKSIPVMTIRKEPSFFERRYSVHIDKADIKADEEIRALLSLVLLVQFMRGRG